MSVSRVVNQGGTTDVNARVSKFLRKILPSTVILSRTPLLMIPLSVIDRLISLPFVEFRRLPPLRYRVRIGTGNRILFNQPRFMLNGLPIFFDYLSRGLMRLDSHVLDVGCGCGRHAQMLERGKFRGLYTGIDIDRELIEWDRKRFKSDYFQFHHINYYNKLYNPGGTREPIPYPCEDGSQDLVIAFSLLTHLLEEDLRWNLREAYRVLKPGGHLSMTVFCLEELEAAGLQGHRWTFQHRIGSAFVENQEHPEAAVAYQKADLIRICKEVGFEGAEILPGKATVAQTELTARKVGEPIPGAIPASKSPELGLKQSILSESTANGTITQPPQSHNMVAREPQTTI